MQVILLGRGGQKLQRPSTKLQSPRRFLELDVWSLEFLPGKRFGRGPTRGCTKAQRRGKSAAGGLEPDRRTGMSRSPRPPQARELPSGQDRLKPRPGKVG